MTRAALAAEVNRLRAAKPHLTYGEIGARLGISRSYANELAYDPEGAKTRARKAGYRQPCPDCGNLMDGSSGPNHPPTYCAVCVHKHRIVWTHDTVIAAFQAFHQRAGRTPLASDTTAKWPSVARKLTPERLAEIPADHGLPSPSVVTNLFGSWRNAQHAAGLPTSPTGGTPNHRTQRRDSQRRDNQILDAIRDGADTSHNIALATRRNRDSLNSRLQTLTERGLVTRTRARWRWGHPYIYEIAEPPETPRS